LIIDPSSIKGPVTPVHLQNPGNGQVVDIRQIAQTAKAAEAEDLVVSRFQFFAVNFS